MHWFGLQIEALREVRLKFPDYGMTLRNSTIVVIDLMQNWYRECAKLQSSTMDLITTSGNYRDFTRQVRERLR